MNKSVSYHQDFNLGDLTDDDASLIYEYKTNSKYSDYWIELKTNLRIDIKLDNRLSTKVQSKIYRRSIFNLYNLDGYFWSYCIKRYGTQLKPYSYTGKDTLTLILFNDRFTGKTKLNQLLKLENLQLN